jgi:hypothetical protein
MDTQNLWIIDAKSTNNLFDNLCQIYARTIDLAQEEQVHVVPNQSKAKSMEHPQAIIMV